MTEKKADALASHIHGELPVKNRGDPIRLTAVRVDGVAAESAEEGAPVKLWVRLFLTSDNPYFHRVIDGLEGFVAEHTLRAGSMINIKQANSVLLVVRPDMTADLWVDTVAVAMNAMSKRAVTAGEVVYDSDIIDIVAVDFPDVPIGSEDKVVYLFREGWRFGLGFDFNQAGQFNREDFCKEIGTLYRRLKYRHLYELLENPALFARLTTSGWFPFSELIGREFRDLLLACETGFSFAEAEAKLLTTFDSQRIDSILERWLQKAHFKSKERLLVSALNGYKNNDPVAVLKIILTEIEGILAIAYGSAVGGHPRLATLLKFAKEAAERRTGGPDTLFFPAAFAEYLRKYTYANFDPDTENAVAGSRHAVGHGAAPAESYTQIRALQAILTLDQLAFYT
jgi:hypothetical protein